MTLAQSLGQYIENLGLATLGQDLIIGRAPSSKEVTDDLWWMISNGDGTVKKNKTGEYMKAFQFLVYRRSRNYRQIDEDMQSLQESLDCDGCTQLDGFDTVDMEASLFPTDDDLDSEDRKVGLLQVNIRIYKEC